MGTRSVRLDDETERALARLTKMTGLSISEILKRGIAALEQDAARNSPRKPYDIYRKLDLGSGGYAIADSREAKAAVRRRIREKHDK